MPSATDQNWEKYKKNFADDEEPEKKITPLTDELVVDLVEALLLRDRPLTSVKGYPCAEDLRRCTIRCCDKKA